MSKNREIRYHPTKNLLKQKKQTGRKFYEDEKNNHVHFALDTEHPGLKKPRKYGKTRELA